MKHHYCCQLYNLSDGIKTCCYFFAFLVLSKISHSWYIQIQANQFPLWLAHSWYMYLYNHFGCKSVQKRFCFPDRIMNPQWVKIHSSRKSDHKYLWVHMQKFNYHTLQVLKYIAMCYHTIYMYLTFIECNLTQWHLLAVHFPDNMCRKIMITII